MSMEVAGIPARGLEGNQTAPPPVLDIRAVHQEGKSSPIRERLAAQSVEEKLQDIEGLSSFLNRRLKFSINRELQEVVVKIVDADGHPAMAATTGPTGAELGSGAETGSIVSAGPVLVSGAKVTGNVLSSGLVTLRNGGVVSGSRRSYVPVTPFQSVTILVGFDGPSLGPIQLEPPNGGGERATTVPPGHYSNVTIKSRNRVNLSSGAYQFDSLTLEPQARLVIDDAAGPVYLDVRDSLLFKGAVDGASGKPPAFRLVYVGTASPSIESAFSGVLIAPNTSMRLATPPDGKSYRGAFFARTYP